MKEERKITVEGQDFTVVISDEHEALLAASAAGRAIIGLWDPSVENQDLSPAVWLVEDLEDLNHEFLERVVRRKQGMPWLIGETKHLWIREFSMEDIDHVHQEEGDGEADRIFYTPEALESYIQNQYGFYQYGIWALVEKKTGVLVGKAGVSNGKADSKCLELGYHIFHPYRKKGYAREACLEIQKYVRENLDCGLYAKIDASNEASIRVIESCGFPVTWKKCNEEEQCSYLCFLNC